MRQEVINALKDPELIRVREYHIDRLTRLFNGEKLDKPFILSGIGGGSSTDPFVNPEKWVEEALESLYQNAEKALDMEVFRPLCATPWTFGVHFTDRLFGCELRPTVISPWGEMLYFTKGLDNEVGELKIPDLETNETWRAAKRVTEALVATGVTVPFFTTQVLGEPWNQTFNLYRSKGLLAFYDNPKGMRRDLSVVTDTLVEMHKWYKKTIPYEQFQPICAEGRFQPRGYGQMCGCSTHMISNEIYEDFVRENDERVLGVYPNGGMFHLCGGHTQHLPSWSKMKCLRAFQLNDRAADDFEKFFNGTRDDQIFYVNYTERMTYDEVMRISGGRRCVMFPR